jgi:capsular exopolysaccharide synthesis family protein
VSKFFKALEQAERDRARQLAQQAEAPTPGVTPTPGSPGVGPTAAVTAERGTPGALAAGCAPVSPAPMPAMPSTLRHAREAPPAAPPSAGAPDSPRSVATGPGTADRRDRPVSDRPQRRAAPARSATPLVASPRPGDAQAKVEEHLVSLLFPATFEAEQYRALRHVLEQQRAVSGLAVVAVTSPAVGDGKTTTAINLAGALAQAPGARVLLIDADLRRPSVAEHLGLGGPAHAERPGLVDALVDSRFRLDDIAEPRADFSLTVVPAGLPPPAPYELLQSARFAELLEEARRDYHYVILDTPPLVAVPDGRIIMKGVDGFVLVVRAHKTPRKLVEEALSLSDPQKLLGLVFNRDDRPLSGYYRGYHTSHPLSVNGNRTGRFGRLLRSGRRNGMGR